MLTTATVSHFGDLITTTKITISVDKTKRRNEKKKKTQTENKNNNETEMVRPHKKYGIMIVNRIDAALSTTIVHMFIKNSTKLKNMIRHFSNAKESGRHKSKNIYHINYVFKS